MKCKFCKKEFFRSIGEINRGRTSYCSVECYQKNRILKSQVRMERIIRDNAKQCQMCKKTKDLSNFYKYSKSKDGFGSYCKECKIIKTTKSWKINRHKHLEERKNNHLVKTYGITLVEYKKILSNQSGMCAICQEKYTDRKLSIDHDHKTGKIRGLLCVRCNQGLGLFKDNTDNLSRAKNYLLKNNWY